MNKLARLINELDEEDLDLIRKDLEAGNLDRLIRQKLREKQDHDQNKVCPVCQSPIDDESLTLIFGPKDFRKKASFCALDCLEYFIEKIKKEKKAKEDLG
jgi:hypothetical protein